MSDSPLSRGLRKALAAVLSAALILTAPGLPVYQALAQNVKVKTGKVSSKTSPIKVVTPVVNSLNTGLSNTSLQGGLKNVPLSDAVVPTVDSRGLTVRKVSAVETLQSGPKVSNAVNYLDAAKALQNKTAPIAAAVYEPGAVLSGPGGGKTLDGKAFDAAKFKTVREAQTWLNTPKAGVPAESGGAAAKTRLKKSSGFFSKKAAALVAALGLSGALSAKTAAPGTAAPTDFSGVALGGEIAGNVIAVYYPIPQVADTVRGKPVDKWGMILGAAASFAGGLVIATIQGNWIWGVQNIFQGVMMLAVFPVQRWAAKAPSAEYKLDASHPFWVQWSGRFKNWANKARGAAEYEPDASLSFWKKLGARLKNDRALQLSLIIGGASIAASFLVWLAVSSLVPAALAAAFGAGSLGAIDIGTRAAVAALYIGMFVPTILLLRKGKPAFSPAFSMAFLLATAAFLISRGLSAFGFIASEQRISDGIYFGVNVINAAVAFWAYRLAVRLRKKDHPPPGEKDSQAQKGTGKESPRDDSRALELNRKAPEWAEMFAQMGPGPKRVHALFDAAGRLRKVSAEPPGLSSNAALAVDIRADGTLKLPYTWGNWRAAGSFESGRLAGLAAARKVLDAVNAYKTEAAKAEVAASEETEKNVKDLSPPKVEEKAETVVETPVPPVPPVTPPPVDEKKTDGTPKPEEPHKYLYEDILGNRRVLGIKHDTTLKPLAHDATVDQIIDHISRQFGIPRAKVLAAAAKQKLYPDSSTAAWFGVYDRLQAANRQRYNELDQNKYGGIFGFLKRLNDAAQLAYAEGGKGGFRQVTGKARSGWLGYLGSKDYAPGWRGTLKRLSQAQIHLFGFFFRFPYSLFDSFVFGYFRRAAAFELRHATSNFLDIGAPGAAEKVLANAIAEGYGKTPGVLGKLKAKPWFRALQRAFIRPVLDPLMTFMVRRVTLAVMSAVAMGLMGALAPMLPMSFALVSSASAVAAAHGVAEFLGAVPFVGDLIGPAIGKAVETLLKDLVLGTVLQTATLSTLLTWPKEVRQRIKLLRADGRLSVGRVFYAMFGALFSKRNLTTFGGLFVVGAEIEGIMTYAKGLDTAVGAAWKPITGRDFTAFHDVGAAVERPAEWTDEQGVVHKNLIPFGGAITWGGTLLHQAEVLTGLSISDTVMSVATGFKGAAVGTSEYSVGQSKLTAQQVFQNAVDRGGPDQYKFDPDLYKKGPEAVNARIAELLKVPGGLDAELKAAAQHRDLLQKQLAGVGQEIADGKKQSQPVLPEELAEYQKLLKELGGKTEEDYLQSKLSQKHDIKNPQPDDYALLQKYKSLQEYYDALLVPPSDENPGMLDDLAVKDASWKALQEHLSALADGRSVKTGEGLGSPVDSKTIEMITNLVAEIETLRAEAGAEMTNRDAISQLLSATNKTRNMALRDRRDGAEMFEFHQNLSKLATVMEIALSLNEIAAAQQAIKEMIALMDQKLGSINASQSQNQQNQDAANTLAGQAGQWTNELNNTIAADNETAQRLVDQEARAGMAVKNIAGFQTDVSALIAKIDAADGGASGDALTEYQRRIDLLPQVVEWRTNGGDPNNPDAFSLKKLNENLAEIQDNIVKAEEGLGKIAEMPLEMAGMLIPIVPGPKVDLTNPTQAQLQQMLVERKAYWEGRRAEFQKNVDMIDRRLDPSNTAMVTDEFGVSTPESLPRWRAQEVVNLEQSQAAVDVFTAQIDAAADQIFSVTGVQLPHLSGLNLEQMTDAIKTYGDQVKAITVSGDSNEAFVAQMNLILLAKLVPYTAHEVIRWAKADATIKGIDKATSQTLPLVQPQLEGLVTMVDEILEDVVIDKQIVDSGNYPSQAIIDRKTDLIANKILPRLRGAETMISQTLIPFQQESIDSVAPETGDMFKLFDAQKTLMTSVKDLYGEGIPWALASFGAPEGDKTAAHANIADWRDGLKKEIDGYDDETGHHKGLREWQVEIEHRKDPDFNGTETLYGEEQPFSLPKKIEKYTQERSQRVAEFNQRAVTVNEIIGKIEGLSGQNLSAYRLPTDVTPDEAGVAKMKALVDAKVIENLGAKIKEIGDAAVTASNNSPGGGGIALGNTSANTAPTGTQPPITLEQNQQLAMLCKDLGARLVNTSVSEGVAFPLIRFLYSDAVVKGADDALKTQVPAAESFLNHGVAALNTAIDSTAADDAYVDDPGSQSAETVYDRKTTTFTGLQTFLREGIEFMKLKQTWNQEGFATITDIQTFYNGLASASGGGLDANGAELQAANTIKSSLQKTYDELEATRVKISGWMAQLNDPNESALRKINMSLSELQEKTLAVLEQNIKYNKLDEQFDQSQEIIQSQLTEVEEKQLELQTLLDDPALQDGLPADLVARINALRLNQGMWAMDSGPTQGAETLVVPKAQFPYFLDMLMGMFQGENAPADLMRIKNELLNNPQGLAALIPESAVLDIGGKADGFYIVYKSKFAVPHGLDTASMVTLGNVAQVWGSNVSVTGYTFSSPPNPENAPYGDKGLEVQFETLKGENYVNYLNIDLHRFALDIPPDDKPISQITQSRMMIFDDYAMMLWDGKLYVGLVGFGDFALQDPKNQPQYYGGNFKTAVKMTPVMSLTAEQQLMFANDPRQFRQDVNLNFTGYEEMLDKDWVITAQGEKKDFSRTTVGPKFDLGKLLDPNDKGHDAFTLDLFLAQTSGSDDINQRSAGATLLKGFTLRDNSGKPWMVINNKATGEIGEKTNTFSDRLSVTFPKGGWVISGQGKLVGDASAYYGEISKKTGETGSLSLGYGSPYIGHDNRLMIKQSTSFTLGDVWKTVSQNAKHNLKGGDVLKGFNQDMDEFFKQDVGGEESSKTLSELKAVFSQDVGSKLISQEMGILVRDIQELRKHGALLDNTRVRGMVGFVTNPIGTDPTDLAVGGGFVTGTQTELTLTKTQRELIEAKTESLFEEGLKLQLRFLQLTKDWQAAVSEMAQAQWELKMAKFTLEKAPSATVRAEAQVRVAEANDRLHQALLKYNILSGRDPTDESPFGNLSAEDLETLMAEIQTTIAAPDGLESILHGLDQETLDKHLGPNKKGLIDWIPWVERLTFNMGMQLQDQLANQAFGIGGSVRLPIYDPSSKDRDKAFVLETEATVLRMQQTFAEQSLLASKEVAQAQLWRTAADALRPGLKASADALEVAIKAYRNGLIPETELKAAFDAWHWYMSSLLEADAKASVASAWSHLDDSFVKDKPRDPETVTITKLEDALDGVVANSLSLSEIAKRQQASIAMTEANSHRIQKFWLDIYVGANLTATGVGWLPQVAVSGVPITPVIGFELKPTELAWLQTQQGEHQTEYYEALKGKLESDLAVSFYQNIVAYNTAEKTADVLETRLIPQLKAEGAPQQKLDDAKQALLSAQLAREQAKQTLNFLLGRNEHSPLDIDLDEEAALLSLNKILAQKDPVGSQESLLYHRVQVAKHHETMVDKDLHIQQLHAEPVSLVVSSFARLIKALGSNDIGDPEKVAAARVQTLSEERAQDSFAKQLPVAIERLKTQLSLARSQLAGLSGKTDPESELVRLALESQVLNLKAGLAALGQSDSPTSGVYAQMPLSFVELKNRLAETERRISATPPSAPAELIAPQTETHPAESFLRYFYAKSTLDQAVVLNQSFSEGWIEVRLKSKDTPPEVLLALANLRSDKADRIYKTNLAGASAKAEILATQFEANVRLLRWIDARLQNPDGGAFNGNLTQFRYELTLQLKAQQGEMTALLNLDPADPDANLERLIALVPDAPSGARDLDALAGQFTEEIYQKQLPYIRETLFEGGLPEAFGGEDQLMNQIKANVLSERMSYKGFTPVAAFGLFRGKTVGGLFLEAPDPRQIERGLEDILSDVLRQDLQASGKLQELTLKLHALMSKVEDGGYELEMRRKLVQDAEADYKAKMALADSPAGVAEARASQDRLVKAWIDFSSTMTEVKNDFITLVTELEALGQGKPGGLRPFLPVRPLDELNTRRDPKAELLGYWTERLQDVDFQVRQDAILDKLSLGATPELRARLKEKVRLYRQAVEDAESVLHMEFSERERLELLIKNDKEGKRQALQSVLAELLASLGSLDPHSNPAWKDLLDFFRADIAEQSEQADGKRVDYAEVSKAMREAYWHAMEVPDAVEGSFQRLEKLYDELDDARQLLLTSYLTDLKNDPKRFVLKDLQLDAYLKAQQAFDAEVIALMDSKEVRADKSLARLLDGLYDVREVLSRSIDGVRSGRGVLALDALIMLEDARLHAARWNARPGEDLEGIALALENLRLMRERWKQGSADLAPLFALTRPLPDGKRSWTVEGWLTAEDLARLAQPLKKDGRSYIVSEDPALNGLEIIGGVDVDEAAHEAALKALKANEETLKLTQEFAGKDFVLLGEDAAAGVSYDQVFGPGGLHAQGRVFFFTAPKETDKAGALHYSVHPLKALSRPPEESVIYVYLGDKPLARGVFPTLESVKSSSEAADFKRLAFTEKGAYTMIEHALANRALELRRGWVEVKLGGTGFARDASGQVVDLYQTKDAFADALAAFKDAPALLKAAEKELALQKAALGPLEKEAGRLKQLSDESLLEYNETETRVRDRVHNRLVKEFRPRQSGESEQLYKAAFELEWNSRVVQDKEFKAAQKKHAPHAKKYNDAVSALKLQQVKVKNRETDVADAKLTLEHSKTWSVYLSRDLSLGLDAAGGVVRVSGAPVWGALPLDDALGDTPVVKTVTGELYAAVVDEQGRLAKYYTDEDAVDQAAGGWKLYSLSAGADQQVAGPDGTVAPVYRISHYEDPSSLGADGKPLPVLLNGVYLQEQLSGAEKTSKRAKNYGLMPWRWGNMLLQLPRGLVEAPAEVISGRDSRQHHYLGRVTMSKTEGGDTRHLGFFRQAAGSMDILNLRPDYVERYYDPSQFPDFVQIDSPLLPGQNIFSKDPRTLDGKKDVHFGVKSAQRAVAHDLEDIAAQKERTLSRFVGGSEELLLQTIRGRDGTYGETKRVGTHGSNALWKTLEDPLIALDPLSNGSGAVVVSAAPGNIAVDLVERRVTIHPGAQQYADQAGAFTGYPSKVVAAGSDALKERPGLEQDESGTLGLLQTSLKSREAASAEKDALWKGWHKLAWRIGAQEALEARLARLQEKAKELGAESAWWSDYLDKLLTPVGPTDPIDPTDPTDPGPGAGGLGWLLVLLAVFAALSGLLALRRWRRRRPA